MIKVCINDSCPKIKFHTFSGGEEHVTILGLDNYIPENTYQYYHATIFARINSSSELIRLLLVTESLRSNLGSDCRIELVMPYIPYARQDRACSDGDSFSLKVFANLINAQDYYTVTVLDSHSGVATALLDRVIEVKQYELAWRLKELIEQNSALNSDFNVKYIIAPDAGASKKAVEFTKAFNEDSSIIAETIQALKVRDPATGNITSTQVLSDDLNGSDCLIVDDLVDGGKTFTELAKVLKQKGASKIGLFVSHGIFSRGLDIIFDSGIDAVFTTNSLEQKDPRVQVVYDCYYGFFKGE